MTKDAKAAEKQRLAEALRANLKRRKAARDERAVSPAMQAEGERQPAKPAADGGT